MQNACSLRGTQTVIILHLLLMNFKAQLISVLLVDIMDGSLQCEQNRALTTRILFIRIYKIDLG